MQDGGVIPTTGFPRDGGTAKEGHRKDDSITEQTMHLIQHMHSVTIGHLGVIPSKRAFSERFESSREVVVHGDGRGTSRSGSSCTRVVVEVGVLATEVVHVGGSRT